MTTEQEDQLRASARLLNAVGQAVVAWDLDGVVTYLNDAAEAMYGWPRDIAMGRQADELSGVQLSAEQLAAIADTLAAGRAWTGEVTVGRADGTVTPVWVTNTPVIEDEVIIGYIGVSLDISERKEAEARLWHSATHDALTDLANHESLTGQIDERLGRLDHGVSLTVVLVDLGSLETVNDTFGYAVGQGLIQHSARHLQRLVHAGDLLGRFSDHTFAVCCSHDITDIAALAYADRLRQEVSGAEMATRPDIHLSVAGSVVSVTPPTDDAADVLRCAATALTIARRSGTTKVYDESMRHELDRRNELEALVDRTIASGTVTLGYQPVVRLHDEVTIGAEALLRLLDENGAPAPALEVIEAAERTGRIGELGGLVLREACRNAAAWQAALPDRPISISVNVSASQLSDPTLPSRVAAALADTGLEPSALWLEITESALMRHPRRCAMVLAELKSQGVRLSADDFGTGYSSLAYLRRFPLDTLKVDQTFVAGLPESLEDFAIIQAVLAMADALGLMVIAEGVERPSQLTELRSLGISYGQGFLWSPAVPPAEFLARMLAEAEEGARSAGRASSLRRAPARSVLASGASAEERIDATLSVLAHELRQPLTVILGYANLLERADPTVTAETPDTAAIIGRAATRMERILTNVLEAGSVDADDVDLELAEVDLVALVRTTVEDLVPTVSNELTLSEVPPDLLLVPVDAEQIQQVLHNLIGNASKFSPAGSRIDVTVSLDDDFVDISVIDEGGGIEPGELGLVFRKYGRASTSTGGTGIGLFLARHIARHHGGDIVYRRRADVDGSTLVLRLPRPDEHVGDLQPA